ncbi:hypothetical protein [Actinoplanes derwentensis]|uniref:IrrE N-terminal-like domain-containing protein n=1 Tax=Actinoplanes derwentensis TaxID=113562 RepID=A0A1H2DES5_9ACTN|nr:hypothetical protein [Actinoplanes derwentensis]GID84786.1 hypothetical protein Ade03nite_37100 [Actinoplanes derwentensis]SDT81097.1 hypothetical protein SAMN04489716_9493 [Actinoplanes derwentensis]
MADRALRRRCERILADLGLPDAAGVRELCDVLAGRQGRPIHLIGEHLPTSSPCGLAVRTERFDVVFYEAGTSRMHQEHIIRHELGHLICGHLTAPVLDAEASRLLLPDLDPSLVQAVLGRTDYSEVQEKEAEMIASLLLRRSVLARPRPAATEDPVLNRLHHTLIDPGGR